MIFALAVIAGARTGRRRRDDDRSEPSRHDCLPGTCGAHANAETPLSPWGGPPTFAGGRGVRPLPLRGRFISDPGRGQARPCLGIRHLRPRRQKCGRRADEHARAPPSGRSPMSGCGPTGNAVAAARARRYPAGGKPRRLLDAVRPTSPRWTCLAAASVRPQYGTRGATDPRVTPLVRQGSRGRSRAPVGLRGRRPDGPAQLARAEHGEQQEQR